MEKSTLAFYQALAADPEGQTVSFSIAGGADAARFAMTGDGRLSFVSPPDATAPSDADGNNVYLVQLKASDGQSSTTLNLQVTVTNDRAVKLHRVATGFVNPVAAAAVPGASQLLIGEKAGAIYQVDVSTGAKTLIINVGGISTEGDRGVLALAVPPNYASVQYFWLMFAGGGGNVNIQRFLRNPAGPFVPDNFGATISYADPATINISGWLGYDASGILYAATSDGSGSGDPSNAAQDPSSKLGKLIQITANPDPYAGATAQFFLSSIYALGLHAPGGGSFSGGQLILGDRGRSAAEEIDIVPLTGAGRNYGWPYKEGSQTVRSGAPAGLLDPATEYRHATGPQAGTGVVAGYVYRGPVSALSGEYVFGDRTGQLWTVPATRLLQAFPVSSYDYRPRQFTTDMGTLDQPTAFTEDSAGNLYILDRDGDLFRVEAT